MRWVWRISIKASAIAGVPFNIVKQLVESHAVIVVGVAPDESL